MKFLYFYRFFRVFCLFVLGVNISFAQNLDYSGQDLSWSDFSDSSLDFTNSNWQGATLDSANFSSLDLSNADFFLAKLSNANMTSANLTNANFQFATLSNTDFSNANLTNADFRGSFYVDLSSSSIILKNTIATDGEILNFTMSSVDDSFTINSTAYYTISAKISSNATISSGAVLTLNPSAQLEIQSGASLELGDGGTLQFNYDGSSSFDVAMLTMATANSLSMLSGSSFELCISVSDFEFDSITLMSWADDGSMDISSLENLMSVYVNSEKIENFYLEEIGNSVVLSFGSVPEPSTYALIFGVLSVSLAYYRKRKVR